MKITWNAAALLEELNKENMELCRQGAEMVAEDARASTEFQDVTGALRESISTKKSIFMGGGWLVRATAPHAHLVELGHGGPQPARPRPFLRNALRKNAGTIRGLFRAKYPKVTE